MNQQERAILIWSVFFVMSGVVFMAAFLYSPVIGTMVTTAYIMMYMGLSAAFIIVFREISVLRKDTIDTLQERKEELEEVEKALKGKYFRKKIDDASYRRMVEDYEKMITEIEVKIKRLEKNK
jgi:membrane protein implicated in regulation of membrane protease activity